jgi:hypothetical protein
MPDGLWVEYKTNNETCIENVSTEACVFVSHFIKNIRNEPQLAIQRDSRITLYGPSGTVIRSTEPISVLIPGNSTENPLRVQASAPPLITLKPAPDADLTSFWNSLRGLQDKGGFLHFPIKPKFFPEKLNSLYIRKAYVDLFRIICNNLNSENVKKERIHRMVITGTPGTGKTVFLFYILWKLSNMETTKTVVLRRQTDDTKIFIFQNDGCWITLKFEDMRYLLDDPATWYLTDTLSDPPGHLDAVTILVSSPARRHYSKLLKELPCPPLHYLPLWSLEELQLVGSHYGKPPEKVEERFDKIGGLARFVLEEDEDLEKTINQSIGSLALDKIMSITLGNVSKEDQISHRIVHFEVKPPNYTECTVIMASAYVLEKALQTFLLFEETDVKRFLLLSADVPSLAVLRGFVFESYVHQKLSTGGEFLVRCLDDKTESTLKFPERILQKFRNVSECTDLNVYYLPTKKNQPCIDSLIVKEGYFQITTRLDHPIKRGKMKEIMNECSMDKFYFVVPHTIFKEFEKQKFEEDQDQVQPLTNQLSDMGIHENDDDDSDKDKKRKITRTNNSKVIERDFIQQYVISIPIDPRLDLSELEKKRNEILAASNVNQSQMEAS